MKILWSHCRAARLPKIEPMIDDIAAQVIEQLKALQQSIAVAESCAGGRLSAALTSVPGASEVYLGGIVSYSNEVKHDQLGVSEELLRQHGAVSEQVARAMAVGVRDKLHADYGIGITGVAGPGGGTPDKPVGLVYVGWAGPNGYSNVARCRFPGGREEVQQASVEMALAGMLQQLGLIEL